MLVNSVSFSKDFKRFSMTAFRYPVAFLILCLLIAASAQDYEDGLSQGDDPQDSPNCKRKSEYIYSRRAPSSEENSRGSSGCVNKIPPEEIEKAFENCPKKLAEIKDLILKLKENGNIIKERKADLSLLHSKNMSAGIREMETAELPFQIVSNELTQKYDISRDDAANELPKVALNGESSKSYRDECLRMQPQPQCDRNYMYRTADERCNNLENPTWGMATACQQRIMPAYYSGNSEFRRSVDGGPLPEPRTLSLNLHYNLNRPTNYVNHMYMFFGQLLDHDITLTPITTTVDNEAIECCPPQDETHPQCAPIIISPGDPFYSQFGITCLNFVRSAICPTCTLGQLQKMNQVTSYIDGSFMYGNSENETRSLRTNDGTGRMRSQETNSAGELLPRSSNPNEDQCSFPETNDICFEAGDPRANQHTVLTSLQTIFLREHNRLATQLGRINPQWDDETIFQEARRIVAAVMQVITFKEYLPITLGKDRMSYFKLWFSNRGTTKYDPNVDATMILESTTAAFRFGHSLINSIVANRPLNSTGGRRYLRNEYFQPFPLYNGIMGSLVMGTTNSPAQWFDRHMVPDATDFLYRVRGNATGLDLASININRGRDHGVPPYVDMVRYCSDGEIVVTSFSDLVNKGLMQSQQAEALQQNYGYVEDVDLWPGILMEIPNNGAVVGPTAACIIGIQFYNLKYGDRFYVEHGYQVGSFTYQQLQELRQVALSHIMCLNTDATEFPENAMLFNSRNNPMISCRYVTGVNLNYWKE